VLQGRIHPGKNQKQQHACCVIGTNICASELSAAEVIAAYKRQSPVASGCRFLQDPRLCISSLLIKKPGRRQGLLMVMTLAVLVYSVAQRRLRQHLVHDHETGPNQLNHPIMSPTLRWVFQLLEGMHRVRVTVHGQVHDLIEGLNDVQFNVLRLFGQEVCCLYQIPPS